MAEFKNPTKVLEWDYVGIPPSVYPDKPTDTNTDASRQMPTYHADSLPTIVPETPTNTPTIVFADTPTAYRQADIPTYYVGDNITRRIVIVSGRVIIVATVVGGVIVGVGYILVEVFAILSVLATKAAEAAKAVVEFLLYATLAGGGLWIVWQVLTSGGDDNHHNGGGGFKDTYPTTPTPGQGMNINININGNQKIN